LGEAISVFRSFSEEEGKRMKILKFVIFVGVLVMLCLIGCSKPPEDKTADAVETVKRYNGLLRRTYLEAKISLLEPVATEKIMNKVFPVILALRSQNSSMIATQNVFSVVSATVNETRASVRADETWEYYWQDKDTGAITKPIEKTSYRLEYILVRERSHWKVENIQEMH